MSLRNLLKHELISCSEETSIETVAQQMAHRNIGAIVVVRDHKPAGIITDRDIALKCVGQGLDYRSHKAVEIMTPSVETVSLDEGIYKVIEKMKEHKIRRVPVVDETGRAVGLLSFGDLIELLSKELSLLAEPARPEEPKLEESAA